MILKIISKEFHFDITPSPPPIERGPSAQLDAMWRQSAEEPQIPMEFERELSIIPKKK